MTQEEIQEYNKKCAEFIGVFDEETDRFVFDTKLFNVQSYSFSEKHHKKQLCFDVGWDWIMEIVEKIEELDIVASFQIENPTIYIWKSSEESDFEDIEIDIFDKTKKEAVVEAINQFLIFYNEKV